MIVLMLDAAPDLFEKDTRNYSQPYITKPPVKDIVLTPETENLDFWDKVRKMNNKDVSTTEDNSAVGPQVPDNIQTDYANDTTQPPETTKNKRDAIIDIISPVTEVPAQAEQPVIIENEP